MRYGCIVVCSFLAVLSVTESRAQILGEQKVSLTEGNLGSGTLRFSDFFGSSVSSIGDVDQDGILDLLVGAEGDDTGGRDAGSVYLLFMNVDGTVKSSRKIGSPELSSGSLDAGDYFGGAVAGLQDLNEDGFRDVIVGARGDDDGTSGEAAAGAVWVLFLDSTGGVVGSQKISETEGGFSGDLDSGDLFGRSIAFLGDIGEDGTREIAVGAPGDDDGGTDRGAVWILSLDSDGTVSATEKLSDGSGLDADALEDFAAFGTSVVKVGAIDGLRVPLAVGAPHSANGEGEFWFTDLIPGVSASSITVVNSASGDLGGLLQSGDHFGRSLAAPGDLDGDGLPDVLVGAPGGDDNADNSGEFWFTGLQPGQYTIIEKLSATSGGLTGRLAAGDRFGQSLAVIGDLDGNGKVDYVAGTPYADDGLENSGSIFVLFDDRAEPVAVEASGRFENLFVAPYPNPLGGKGTLQIQLATDRDVRVEVFDVHGRLVAALHEGRLSGGTRHQMEVDVTGWPSGTYFCRVTGGEKSWTRAFVVAR